MRKATSRPESLSIPINRIIVCAAICYGVVTTAIALFDVLVFGLRLAIVKNSGVTQVFQ